MTHSNEATAAYPESEWTQRATVLSFREAFDAGRASRDGEITELQEWKKVAEITLSHVRVGDLPALTVVGIIARTALTTRTEGKPE